MSSSVLCVCRTLLPSNLIELSLDWGGVGTLNSAVLLTITDGNIPKIMVCVCNRINFHSVVCCETTTTTSTTAAAVKTEFDFE